MSRSVIISCEKSRKKCCDSSVSEPIKEKIIACFEIDHRHCFLFLVIEDAGDPHVISRQTSLGQNSIVSGSDGNTEDKSGSQVSSYDYLQNRRLVFVSLYLAMVVQCSAGFCRTG